MRFPNNRAIFFIITLLCVLSLAYAYYAQLYQNFDPCPLCVVQRVILEILAILAFIYALHNPKNLLSKVYGLVLFIISAFGIKVAAHHQLLMNLPPEKQPLSCGMPLDVLFKKVPFNSFLHTILQGDAECGKVSWMVFGITPPIAVITLCSIIAILSLAVIFRSTRS